MLMSSAPSSADAVPYFAVDLGAPDLGPWRAGNTGVPGFWSFASTAPGPHVMLVAIIHGNEVAGAHVLLRLLQDRIRPVCGRLTLGFANLDAFDRFDPAHPTASRFVDEDLNRLWDPAVLDSTRQSTELGRARAMRPLIDTADVLLDLHSMLWPSDPLMLCGPSAKGRALALSLGIPALVVADAGHVSGPRLIDYGRFVRPDGDAVACLLEAGQHWVRQTVEVAASCVAALLHHTGLRTVGLRAGAPPPGQVQSWAEVTEAVTAATAGFTFTHPFRGGDIVPRRGTLIANDGPAEIRTPYDDCLLVMPSLRPSRGHTAVRLARFI